MFAYSDEEEQRERDARILDVEAGDDLRLAFGDVERRAVGLGDAEMKYTTNSGNSHSQYQ